MQVCFAGKAGLLLETFELNKVQCPESILFGLFELQSQASGIDLLIADAEYVFDSEFYHIPKVRLGLDISIPFKFAALVEVIAKTLESRAYTIGHYYFYPSARLIKDKENSIVLRLTEKESALLNHLVHSGENGSGVDEVLKVVWGYISNVETTTVKTHIQRLKTKFSTINLQENILLSQKRCLLRR